MIKQLTTLTEEGGDLKGGENKDTYSHKMKKKGKKQDRGKGDSCKAQGSQQNKKEVSVLENGGYKVEEQYG